MKTNFSSLTELIENNTFSSNNKDIIRLLRDLEFLLKDVEKKIFLRKLMSATYPMRMAWDLSRELIVQIVNASENDLFQKWNKNIKATKEYKRNLANKKGRKFVDRTPGYLSLWHDHPNISLDGYIYGIGTFKQANDIFSEMNGWMHYRYLRDHKENNTAHNINDKSTLLMHRNEVRYNKPTLFQIVGYLRTLWYVVINPMKNSGLFKDFDDYNYEFDDSIYDDVSVVLDKFLELKHIDDLVSKRKKCPICRKGNFNKPSLDYLKENKIKFPFGAYLICDNEKCLAKVDSTLKVKRNIDVKEKKYSPCPECKREKTLQERYSLTDDTLGKYLACNECRWNNKIELKKDITSDIKDIISQFEENWDDWYE